MHKSSRARATTRGAEQLTKHRSRDALHRLSQSAAAVEASDAIVSMQRVYAGVISST